MFGLTETFEFYMIAGFCLGWVVSMVSMAIDVMFTATKGNSIDWNA